MDDQAAHFPDATAHDVLEHTEAQKDNAMQLSESY
jgi:hypothetical protein